MAASAGWAMDSDDDDDDDCQPPPAVTSPSPPHTDEMEQYEINFGHPHHRAMMGRSSSPWPDSDAERDAERELFGGNERQQRAQREEEEEDAADAAGHPPPSLPRCHVVFMPGFDEKLLGGISAVPPEFFQLPGHGWQPFLGIFNDPDDNGNLMSFRPVRTMCFNIPIECWSSDATRFNHWTTPKINSARAANIAALLGLVYTPLSKGWLCVSFRQLEPPPLILQSLDSVLCL